MQSDDHLNEEQVALRTLGEPLSMDAEKHVRSCPRCTAELDQMSAVVATARSIPRGSDLEVPPARVWEGISAELANDAPLDLPAEDPATEAESAGEVVELSRHRRWSTGLLVAASVAGIVVGATLSLGLTRLVEEDNTTIPTATVVASTTLAALPEREGSGSAEIVDTKTGQELVVDVSGLTSGEGFYEVWLINPDTFAMVGLGALDGGESGRFVIPDGLDLSQYRVVDVSIEPFDGDPVHSTDSVVRGEISA